MTRFVSLAVIGFVLGGCAADFSEETETNAPANTESSTDDGSPVKPYSGQLQRPAETLGTVEEAPQYVQSAAIWTYADRIDQMDGQLPSKYRRSASQ